MPGAPSSDAGTPVIHLSHGPEAAQYDGRVLVLLFVAQVPSRTRGRQRRGRGAGSTSSGLTAARKKSGFGSSSWSRSERKSVMTLALCCDGLQPRSNWPPTLLIQNLSHLCFLVRTFKRAGHVL